MSNEPQLPPGLHYVTRDGQTTYHLDRYFATGDARPIARPERDVLAALLRFCLDGCEYETVRESAGIILRPQPQETA